MSETVQEWIAERTGLILDSQPEQFAENARDGVLMANILISYGIINQDDFTGIIPTKVSHMVLKNWKTIRFWLEHITVNMNDEQLLDICSARGSAALKLFYEVYLVTHGKDHLNYVMVEQKDKRFRVGKVSKVPTEREEPLKDNNMSIPLIDGAEIVKLHKGRLAALNEKCQEMRDAYNRKLLLPPKCLTQPSSPIKHNQESIPRPDQPEQEFSYKELCKMQQDAENLTQLQPDPQLSQAICNQIKAKKRKMAREKELMTKMHKHLLLDLWQHLLDDQRLIFENCVAKKLLKQSMYEKQMANKLFHIRRQKDVIMDHRIALQEEQQRKRDEELLEDVYLEQKRLEDEKTKYYQEKERLLDLHRKLYEQKMKVRAERILKANEGIVNDLVDLALRAAEYKEEHGEEPSRRSMNQWTNMFLKQQPIFDLYEPVEDVAVAEAVDVSEEVEEIFCLEVHRQDQLDQKELEDYLHLNYPWDLVEETILIQLGCNVLGHIVHRLLRSRYPKPEPPPPSLPNMKAAVCLHRLTDLEILPILQQLLRDRKIRVFQIPEAVDFCIEAYKKELTTEYIESHITEDPPVKEKKATKKKERPQKGKKGKSKKASIVSDMESEITKIEKATQSPRIFPGEEIKLTAKAELGKQALELLNSGELLPDSLTSAIAVEYLKSFKEEIEGWVLINFPQTLQQAVQLEHALTSKLPVVEDFSNAEHLSELGDFDMKTPETTEDEKVHSFLLPDPPSPIQEPNHETYLTAFICMECREEESDGLVEFYTNQGCGFEFICEQFDLAAIKKLARLIIGDSSEPRKTSAELFGDTVNYLVDEQVQVKGATVTKKDGKKKKEPKKVVKEKESVQTKQTKESKKTKEKKGAKSKKSKRGSSPPQPDIVKEDKGTQSPEPDTEDEEIIYVDAEPDPNPGEPSWIYQDLSLSNQFEAILAKLWENAEEIYISDFKQLFFIKRIILNAVVPYITRVRTHVKTFVERPDGKQRYLQEFQYLYNHLDEDMREDEEVKAELHCRIAEFRDKLHSICDNRMEENDLLRNKLIEDNWGAFQLRELCNNYNDAMQLELNRCVDTLRLLTDYYSAMIVRSSIEGVFFGKILLDNIKTANRSSFNVIKEEDNSNPYETFIIKSHRSAASWVSKWEAAAMSALEEIAAIFSPKEKGKGKKSKTGKKGIFRVFEPDEEVKLAAPNLIKEWRCAVKGEIERSLLRLNLQKERGLADIQDCFTSLRKCFYGILEDVRGRHQREIVSVDKACEVFQQAVEAEVPLQPQLVLEGDNFFIDPNTALFPDPLPSLELPQPEEKHDTFTISQLKDLVGIFSSLAPNGAIPERHFSYIIQDLVAQEHELKVPELWKRLTPQKIDRLSDRLFGKVELIDWRDFVIFNLNLPYPSEEDLMETRSRFREYDPDSTETVKDYQFYTLRFWFEDAFDQTNPSQLKLMWGTKKLLCTMFKVDQETVNYTALLLKFCRDLDPVVGFAKALQLCLGRYVCWQKEIGDAYVEKIRSSRLERERFCTEAVAACVEVLTETIDKVVHVCDSLVIEDYVSQNGEEKLEVVDNSNQVQTLLDEITESVCSGREKQTSLQVLHEDQRKSFDSSKASVEGEEETTAELSEHNSEASEPPEDVSRACFLPFDALVTVMAATMSWHSKAQTFDDCGFRERMEAIFEGLRREEFDNKVLAHEFLNCWAFVGLLRSCCKFETKDVGEIVRELVAEARSCS